MDEHAAGTVSRIHESEGEQSGLVWKGGDDRHDEAGEVEDKNPSDCWVCANVW